MTQDVRCPNCGYDLEIVLGDFAMSMDGDDVVLSEVNMHGTVELARGTDLPQALRQAAANIESDD